MMNGGCVLAVVLLLVPSFGFTNTPAIIVARSRVILSATGAEEYLTKCLKEWIDLEYERAAFQSGPEKNNMVCLYFLFCLLLHIFKLF